MAAAVRPAVDLLYSHKHGEAAMTRQYLAGELWVVLGHLQAAATTGTARRDAWLLRQAAETVPVRALSPVAVRALHLAEDMCWDSLDRDDTEAFTRQAAAGAELLELGVCAGLLDDT